MFWLQSNEQYDVIACFDPSSRVLEEFKRRDLGSKFPTILHGFFSHLGDRLIAVYGFAGKLFLLIDNQLFELAADDTIEVSGPAVARHLRIVNKAEEVVASLTYSLHGLARPTPGDPTPFIDNEDFDIGLLASNVSKDPMRRAIFTNK